MPVAATADLQRARGWVRCTAGFGTAPDFVGAAVGRSTGPALAIPTVWGTAAAGFGAASVAVFMITKYAVKLAARIICVVRCETGNGGQSNGDWGSDLMERKVAWLLNWQRLGVEIAAFIVEKSNTNRLSLTGRSMATPSAPWFSLHTWPVLRLFPDIFFGLTAEPMASCLKHVLLYEIRLQGASE